MKREEIVKFGQLALQRGMINKEQLQEALLAFQNKENLEEFIQIFMEKGFLTPPQVELLLEKAKKIGQVGNYRILRLLGRGGMGAVYLAEHVQQKNLVALKVLNPEFSKKQDMIMRFLREAKALALLHHKNIVKCYEGGVDKERQLFFIAMEYIEGQSLDQVIEEKGQMDPDEALDIIQQVVYALQAAHSHGFIHRDIKPENILIAKDGTAKLTDFGLVKIKIGKHISLTQTGMFMGTPHYISPEQAQGVKELDIRSDFYSLGITLFQMVTGVLPFDSESALIICQKHLMEELPNPLNYNKMLSPALVAFLRKLTAKTPDERPKDPAKVLKLIEEVRMGTLVLEGYEKLRNLSRKKPNRSTSSRSLKGTVLAQRGEPHEHVSKNRLSLLMVCFLGFCFLGAMVFLLNFPQNKNSPASLGQNRLDLLSKEVEKRGNSFYRELDQFYHNMIRKIFQKDSLVFNPSQMAKTLPLWEKKIQSQKERALSFQDGKVSDSLWKKIQEKRDKIQYLFACVQDLKKDWDTFSKDFEQFFGLNRKKVLPWLKPYRLVYKGIYHLPQYVEGKDLTKVELLQWLSQNEEAGFSKFRKVFHKINSSSPAAKKESFQKIRRFLIRVRFFHYPHKNNLPNLFWTEKWDMEWKKYLYFHSLLSFGQDLSPPLSEMGWRKELWQYIKISDFKSFKPFIPIFAKLLFDYGNLKGKRGTSQIKKNLEKVLKTLAFSQLPSKLKFPLQAFQEFFQPSRFPQEYEDTARIMNQMVQEISQEEEKKRKNKPSLPFIPKQVLRKIPTSLTAKEKQIFQKVAWLYQQQKPKEAQEYLEKNYTQIISKKGKLFFQYFQDFFALFQSLGENLVMGDLDWWRIRRILDKILTKDGKNKVFPSLSQGINWKREQQKLQEIPKYLQPPLFHDWLRQYPYIAREFFAFLFLVQAEYFRQNQVFNPSIKLLRDLQKGKTIFFKYHRQNLKLRLELYQLCKSYKNPLVLFSFTPKEKQEIQKNFSFFLPKEVKAFLDWLNELQNRATWFSKPLYVLFQGRHPILWLKPLILQPPPKFNSQIGGLFLQELKYFLVIPIRSQICLYFLLERMKSLAKRLNIQTKENREALKILLFQWMNLVQYFRFGLKFQISSQLNWGYPFSLSLNEFLSPLKIKLPDALDLEQKEPLIDAFDHWVRWRRILKKRRGIWKEWKKRLDQIRYDLYRHFYGIIRSQIIECAKYFKEAYSHIRKTFQGKGKPSSDSLLSKGFGQLVTQFFHILHIGEFLDTLPSLLKPKNQTTFQKDLFLFLLQGYHLAHWMKQEKLLEKRLGFSQYEGFYYYCHGIFAPFPLFLNLKLALKEIRENLPLRKWPKKQREITFRIKKHRIYRYGLIWNSSLENTEIQPYSFRYGVIFLLPKPPIFLEFRDTWNIEKGLSSHPSPALNMIHWAWKEADQIPRGFFRLKFFWDPEKKGMVMAPFFTPRDKGTSQKNPFLLELKKSYKRKIPIWVSWRNQKGFLVRLPKFSNFQNPYPIHFHSPLSFFQLFFAKWWEMPFEGQYFHLRLKFYSFSKEEALEAVEHIENAFHKRFRMN